MHFLSIPVCLFAASWVGCALAQDSAATPDQDPSLFERLYGNNTQRFDKRCTRMFHALSEKNATLDLQAYEERFEAFKLKGDIPEKIQIGIHAADADKNGQLTKDEFCGYLLNLLQNVHVSELKVSDLDDHIKDFFKKVACTWRDKLPFIKSEVCESLKPGTEATEKTEEEDDDNEEVQDDKDKEKEDKEDSDDEKQGQEVALAKRAMSDKTVFKIGGALMITFGASTILSAISSILLGPLGIPVAIVSGLLGGLLMWLGIAMVNRASKL